LWTGVISITSHNIRINALLLETNISSKSQQTGPVSNCSYGREGEGHTLFLRRLADTGSTERQVAWH
jgi:hypothetical protein